MKSLTLAEIDEGLKRIDEMSRNPFPLVFVPEKAFRYLTGQQMIAQRKHEIATRMGFRSAPHLATIISDFELMRNNWWVRSYRIHMKGTGKWGKRPRNWIRKMNRW